MSAPRAPILVPRADHERLLDLLRGALPDEFDEGLVDELDRATVVEVAPPGVVVVGGPVSFVDAETGRETHLRLVWPHEADAAAGRVSVFAPMGAALLGLSVGQSITWTLPNGRVRTVRVTAAG